MLSSQRAVRAGHAAAGFGPIFGAISRQTPPKQRSSRSGRDRRGSFGQFAIVPFASLLQYRSTTGTPPMLILA